MKERNAFGKSINELQVLRHRIAQLSSEIEVLKVFSYHCCDLYDKKIYDVKLDATGSFDLDNFDGVRYSWNQIGEKTVKISVAHQRIGRKVGSSSRE